MDRRRNAEFFHDGRWATLRPVRAEFCLLFAIVLGGCDRPSAPRDPCTARIDGIAERLSTAAQYADPSGAPPDVALPSARGGVALASELPILVVGRDEVRLSGRGVGGGDDIDRIAEALVSDLRALEQTVADEDQPWLVALWAEPELDVDRLVRLLAGAPPRARFALLARGSDVRLPRAQRPPQWTRPFLRGDAFTRRDRLEEAWERASGSCERARDELPLPASLESAGPMLGTPSVQALISAMRHCGCESDLAGMEAIALAALVPAEGALVRMPQRLRFGPAFEGGRELALEGALDVSELARRLARERRDAFVWVVSE